MAAWSLVVAIVLGAVGAGVAWWQYREHVVRNPGPHVERAHIRAIIAQESPVYYRDGTTRIGVFFEDEHRQYVPFDDLPPAYVMAIVASEDASFWRHRGVDPSGIARAMWANTREGRVVSGGSTLTQQTAKNLYYRPDRSLRSKLVELVNALRLEAHYDKTEILTFYVNQFHVSGNGRGLGIAARYFFDAEVEDLDLLQCAFLAGLVKGPARYDPFIGDAERRERARERAHQRTSYVLRRLVEVDEEQLAGPVPSRGASREEYARRVVEARRVQAEAQGLLDAGFELPFRRGTFRYDSSAVLDEVARRLSEPPFDEVLEAAGVEDPSTSGLVVITTLDAHIQREAIYGLWHHLSEVGMQLEALTAADLLRDEQRGPRFDPDNPPHRHEFRTARVTRHLEEGGKRHLEVDLGGTACVVDRDAVIRVAVAQRRGELKDRYARASTAQVDAVVDALQPDAVVWVSVRDVDEDGAMRCDLEVRPELQGASMVLEDGQIRAMVGGNDNRNFNRATALRQMGSTWKPLIYHAAMKLGWSPDDLLDNQRNVFPFSTTFYYPRPDHDPEPVVSMAWAGVKSENLASIWLLYHLTDRLNGEQVRVLARSLGFERGPEESLVDYRERIQLSGVLPLRSRVEEGLFLQARQEVRTGLALSGHPEDQLALDSLLYGWGHSREKRNVAGDQDKERALDNSWWQLSALMEPCATQHRRLAASLQVGRLPLPSSVPDLSLRVDEDRILVACGRVPEGYEPPDDELLALVSPTEEEPVEEPNTRGYQRPRRGSLLDRLLGREQVDRPAVASGPHLVPEDDILVDERLHLSTLRELSAAIQRRKLAVRAAGDDAPDLYDPAVLYWHQDFRVLLGLRYVASLARAYGVRGEIHDVVSLPLGASEITLEEATTLYSGLVSGQSWEFPGRIHPDRLGTRPVTSPPAPALLISEIRSPSGHVLYRAEPTATEVSPPEIAELTADILRNTVRWGTGRRALYPVKSGDLPVPLGGKTGTTNDFRNAAFFGYAPRVVDGRYRAASGYLVGVYVGYDDNRPMTSGRIRLAGASGALPAWIPIAAGLQEEGLLGEPSGRVDGETFWPLAHSTGLERVAVDAQVGVPLEVPDYEPVDPASASVLVLRAAEPEPGVEFETVERPVRIAPRTDEAIRRLRRQERRERAEERPSVWDMQ